jgi:predicted nucleotidyltransferase
MVSLEKLKPLEAAQQFVSKHFPNCQGALLAGSVVRGEATVTSDLDIVIFDKTLDSSFRESIFEFDWAIEVFAHNLTSYKSFFESDVKRARPSMPRMVSEGIILKDDGAGIIDSIKQEAKELLEKGPEAWSEETISNKRYFITDTLDDFIGSTNRAEEIFIGSALAELVSEFFLRTNHQWIGTSKWIVRALNNFDPTFTETFVKAFDTFYKTGDKKEVIKLVALVLEPHGGRLFNGFSLGKKTSNP